MLPRGGCPENSGAMSLPEKSLGRLTNGPRAESTAFTLTGCVLPKPKLRMAAFPLWRFWPRATVFIGTPSFLSALAISGYGNLILTASLWKRNVCSATPVMAEERFRSAHYPRALSASQISNNLWTLDTKTTNEVRDPEGALIRRFLEY